MLKKLVLSTVFAVGLVAQAAADTKMPFALDWKFEGPSAAYFAAIDNGHFKAEGLDVEISPGKGSLDAIPKIATGAFPDWLRRHQQSDQVPGPESWRTGSGSHDGL